MAAETAKFALDARQTGRNETIDETFGHIPQARSRMAS